MPNSFNMRNIFLLLSLALITSCDKKEESAQAIINKSVAFHGGRAYDSLDVKFKFRDRAYELIRNKNEYLYQRVYVDSLENILLDVLTNNGLMRYFNDSSVQLSPKDSLLFAKAVNSVNYFALLPKPLQNDAVIVARMEDATINDRAYFTIKVSFEEENGGEDHHDLFMYWFDKSDYSMDYLAYQYETNGGGVRFREAYNPQKVDGVIFQDYNNFEVAAGTPLQSLPAMFEAGKLKLLSKIDLHFVK